MPHTILALALWDFSLNFESHEILIQYTGGFDVSEAEYCSARHHMFYWSIQCSTQGEPEKENGGKKEDPKESAPEEFNKKKKESRRIRHKEEAGMQLCCAQIAWFNEASAINTARRRKMGFIYR